MQESQQNKHLVAVIGAGPAGLYAAQYLAKHGAEVVIFNRDIKPGGLAEYGIYPEKHKLRTGLIDQFKRILSLPNIRYQGNVSVGQSGDIKLDQLRRAGFQAFMVTIGAQQNKWLGLPGEDLEGVYQANDIVFNYNLLPGHANKAFEFGHQVVMIGVGNVMLDVLRYLAQDDVSRTVTAYARRGPTEVKFDKKTLKPVANCLDVDAILKEVDAALPSIEKVGKDVDEFHTLLENARKDAPNCDSKLKFRMRFLRTPHRLVGDENGHVKAIVFEITRLEKRGDRVVPYGTGKLETVPTDTVIFSIGSRVDPSFGLPVENGHFVTSSEPRFPIDGISYEVYNPELCSLCEDIFVSGWARLASEGIVGLAKRDAERGARAVLKYLNTLDDPEAASADEALIKLPGLSTIAVDLDDLKNLWRAEQKIAAERGLEEFKFGTHEEMLKKIRGN